MKRRCVFIGDLHVGSRMALWKKHTLEDGTVIGTNEAQDYLIAKYKEFWKAVSLKGYDTVFLLGDLCDGNNRKEFGRNLSSIELQSQVEVAVNLLQPYVVDKKVISVEGSRYHQSIDSSLDRRVTERLANYCDAEHAGLMAIGELEGTGRVLNVEHARMGTMMYKLGALDKESWILDSAENELGYYTDIMVGGHAHWSAVVDLSTGNRSRWMLQAPGWKLWFPYKPGGYGKKIPQIGGIWAEIGPDEINVEKLVYPYFKFHDRPKVW